MGFRDKVQVIKEVPAQIKNITILAVIACIIASLALVVAIGKVAHNAR